MYFIFAECVADVLRPGCITRRATGAACLCVHNKIDVNFVPKNSSVDNEDVGEAKEEYAETTAYRVKREAVDSSYARDTAAMCVDA